MVRMQPKHRLPKALTSLPALIFICVLLVFLSFGLVTMASKSRTTKTEKEESLRELDALESERDNLAGEIDSLETPEGMEEAYRNTFRAAKDGEKLVVIVNADEDVSSADEKGSVGRFFYSLFHREDDSEE